VVGCAAQSLVARIGIEHNRLCTDLRQKIDVGTYLVDGSVPEWTVW